jgi:hypothetical protein
MIELRILTLQAAQLFDRLMVLWMNGQDVDMLMDKAHKRLTRRYAKYKAIRDEQASLSGNSAR